MIVVATMVLHNFIREHGGDDEDFARFDRDPNFIPTIPERYNKYAVPSSAFDGSTSAPNAPTMDLFRDEMATAVSLAWRWSAKFIIIILHVNMNANLSCELGTCMRTMSMNIAYGKKRRGRNCYSS